MVYCLSCSQLPFRFGEKEGDRATGNLAARVVLGRLRPCHGVPPRALYWPNLARRLFGISAEGEIGLEGAFPVRCSSGGEPPGSVLNKMGN